MAHFVVNYYFCLGFLSLSFDCFPLKNGKSYAAVCLETLFFSFFWECCYITIMDIESKDPEYAQQIFRQN